MKKLLLLCDYFAAGGGAGRAAEELAAGLSQKYEILVLAANASAATPHQPPRFALKQFDLKYPLALRNYVGLCHPRAVKILRNVIQDFRPHATLVHNLHTFWSYESLKVLHVAGIKTVLTFHDVSAFTPYVKLCGIKNGDYHYFWLRHLRDAKWTFNPLRNFLIRRYLRFPSKTAAVSWELKKALEQNGIRVDAVIHNGIAIGEDNDPPLSAEEGTPQTIFFGGRLSTSKGMLVALQYLKLLKEKFGLKARVKVAGAEGFALEKMQAEAKNLQVEDLISFAGWLDQQSFQSELQASAVVIVPSVCFDSFPMIILEAMRVGKPVVATTLGGAKEIVEDGITGYIVNPLDTENFTYKIAQILQDKDLAKRLGSAGRKRLEQEFSLEKMTSSYENLLAFL